MTAWGILTTKADKHGLPDELSIKGNENYYAVDGTCRRTVSSPSLRFTDSTQPICLIQTILFLKRYSL